MDPRVRKKAMIKHHLRLKEVMAQDRRMEMDLMQHRMDSKELDRMD
jgi:hypothetical protein